MIEQYLHYLHLKKHAVSSVGIRRVYAIRNRGCRRRREISTSCADFGQNAALHNSPSSSVLEFNIETPCLRTSTLGAQTSRTAPHSANPQIYTNPLMYPRLPSYNLNRNRNHKLGSMPSALFRILDLLNTKGSILPLLCFFVGLAANYLHTL